jgi:hypothetical protein
MLNLDESFSVIDIYKKKNDIILSIIISFFPVLVLVQFLSSQISEINLLQLVPGFYLLLLLSLGSIFLFFLEFFFSVPFFIDKKIEFGTKTFSKFFYLKSLKIFFFLSFILFFLFLNSFIPLSLDSLIFYGESTLENFWSFDQVLSLESVFIIFVIFFSIFPIICGWYFTLEKEINFFLGIWKFLVFLSFLVAGFLTPTLDIFTQLSFSLSSLIFSFFLLNFIKKRFNIKNNELLTLV